VQFVHSQGGEEYLHTIRRRKANWIGHIMRRNSLLKHTVERKVKLGMQVMGRQGRRRIHLLDHIKKTRGYWELKEEALDSTLWRSDYGRGYGPVMRQTTE
jgi:hypothetical protein